MQILRWQVGDALVFRIGELDASAALDGLIREFNLADIRRAAWLTPHFVDDTGGLKGMVQAFLIRSAGQTILIDPGVGNGKHRTAVPEWNKLETDFLQRLRASGVEPGEVDYVVNTHLHFDHVGWQTLLVDDAWRPTFPAARHVMSGEEFRYWQSQPRNEITDQHAGFADSVLPVYEAGLVDLVADDHVVTDGVKLVPSPGHTPHHVSVLLESGGKSALITGDVMHHRARSPIRHGGRRQTSIPVKPAKHGPSSSSGSSTPTRSSSARISQTRSRALSGEMVRRFGYKPPAGSCPLTCLRRHDGSAGRRERTDRALTR